LGRKAEPVAEPAAAEPVAEPAAAEEEPDDDDVIIVEPAVVVIDLRNEADDRGVIKACGVLFNFPCVV
jgi:hypothetical protein